MADRKSNFVFALRLPVQMHAEQIEVGGHFVSLSRKIHLVLMQESGPHFHVSLTQVPSLQHTHWHVDRTC